MSVPFLSLRELVRIWNDFFYTPQSPLSLAMFRMCFGVTLFVESLGLVRWGSELFNQLAFQTVSRSPSNQSDRLVKLIFRVHSFSCLALTFGFMTRLAAALVFLNFCFRMRRNWFVAQGGDNVAKFMSLLLVFSNAGGTVSIDHLLHWRYLGGISEPSAQWPLRLMQIQVSVIYLRTVFWKVQASEWLNGSAVFYAIYRNVNLRPARAIQDISSWIRWMPVTALLTWFTLASETFIGVFVWFTETRNAALAVAVFTHLGYEVFLSIKQFQWLMLSSLLVFLTPGDWMSGWAVIQSLWR